ncbi:MAG: thioesterase domain-containing protein [Pseudobdellovibrio sp.]|nr:thioesterase domain-containing protein [Pseudobdellovibrio sp.]
MNAQALQDKLHSEIPMSKYMQVKVVRANQQEIELECDLAPNHNHVGTAFGGSLATLMVLAAYCQLFEIINETGHVLLKNTSMNFIYPVEEKLRAVCRAPTLDQVKKFQEAYAKKGKARLELSSQIVLADGRIACQMTGEFVGVT